MLPKIDTRSLPRLDDSWLDRIALRARKAGETAAYLALLAEKNSRGRVKAGSIGQALFAAMEGKAHA